MSKYWEVKYTKGAKQDWDALDTSQRHQVFKAIRKVSKSPLSKAEGGYGEPLGNKYGYNLTGCLKIKLRKLGIRVVYRVIRENEIMKIIVIAARADEEVYEIATDRLKAE